MTQNDKAHETLWELIKKTRFAMLTHRDADGQLHSQPLTTQNRSLDQGEPLYFFISRSSHVAQRIAADAQVNLAYANTDDDSYVSVSGTARLSDDRARIAELWSPAAKACKKIRQLSVAFLFAETIRRISDGESVTSLFSEQNNNF